MQRSPSHAAICVFPLSSRGIKPRVQLVTVSDVNPDGISGSSVVLDKVVDYFHYWYRYRYSEDVPDMDIPVQICLELLAAADYLGLDQYVS